MQTLFDRHSRFLAVLTMIGLVSLVGCEGPLPPIPDHDREPPRRHDWTAPISSELGYSTAAILTNPPNAVQAEVGPVGFFARNEVGSWQ